MLLISWVATRLGIRTADMAAVVRGGRVKTLRVRWTVVVPTSDVKRLRVS